MNTDIRVRFAPSNTGHLHIGGVRTALFNWFFAKHHAGTTILRIEDTDRQRSTEEYYDAILEAFDWLGLEWDEGPYRQSKRMDIYQEAANKLLSSGDAYRCTCTPDEVDAMRKKARAEGKTPKYDGTCRDRYDKDPDIPFCLRLRAPDAGETIVTDLLAGDVVFDNSQLDDMVLVRTDGTPTYNFCVAIDDIHMKISHIIRGNDHISNTPKQLLVYQALNEATPKFAHISMILGPDKKRLSKRHGAHSVLEYKERGYLPEALLNYLVRLGWSHGDQEIFSADEIITHFSLEHLNRSAAIFNPEKLLWLNQEYIKSAESHFLVESLDIGLKKQGLSPDQLTQTTRMGIVNELRTRSRTLSEMVEGARFFFENEVELDEEAVSKFLNSESSCLIMKLREELTKIDRFSTENVKSAFHHVMEKKAVKLGKLAQPVRVAITGRTISPGIFETLCLLGKERTIHRLDAALAKINVK